MVYPAHIRPQDLSTFLATKCAIVDGNGTHLSIAGVPHTGIVSSHNNYETDSSPMCVDLDQYGTNTRLVMYQFNEVCSTTQPLSLDFEREGY